MKKLIAIFFVAGLLSGCAYPESAYYVDREFGVAAQDAFDRQIVNKDYRYADKPVEGQAGIHAEPAMGQYHETFSDSFNSEDIDTTQAGGD